MAKNTLVFYASLAKLGAKRLGEGELQPTAYWTLDSKKLHMGED